MSLRLRLLLGLLPLFIAGLVAAEVVTYAALKSSLLSRVDQQLLSAEKPVAGVLQGTPFSDHHDEHGPGGPQPATSLPPGTYGELRSPGGTVLKRQLFSFDASSASQPVLPANLSAPSSGNSTLTVDGTGGVSQYRVLVGTTSDGSGDIVVVALPLDDVAATLHQLFLLELSIATSVTLLLGLATWYIVRRSLRPLSRMADTARSIVATDLSRRVAPATERTEVGQLGLALNSMFSELEGAFAQRARSEQRLRHFVSDASHELRTPLTSMRGYAELFRRNPDMSREDIALAMRRIEDESARMGVLVDDLLMLTRLDQGRALEQQNVDLSALVRDAIVDARAADPDRAFTAQVREQVNVRGDEARLRQVLGNLLRNAQVHTPPGTPVEVSLQRRDHVAVLDVIDHGPGVPPQEADRIFERFHRADAGRSRDQGGSGLGLSIVAAVITAHGGRVGVSQTPGGGATFRIELPLAEAPVAAPPTKVAPEMDEDRPAVA